MIPFVPLNKTEHAAQTWRRPADYGFAARESVAPIAAIEAAQAALGMPLAFAKADGLVQLVAILSSEPGRNSFVASDGKWLGPYVPALFRTFPFRLGQLGEDGEMALCIAAEGYLGSGHEGLFDGAGELSPRVKDIASFLTTFESSRQQTLRAGAALDRAGVLTPWTVKLRDSESRESTVGGVLRVDEEALSNLHDEEFIDLRKMGALGIAYAQVLSTSRIDLLARLARFASPRPATEQKKEPKLDFLRDEDGKLVF